MTLVSMQSGTDPKKWLKELHLTKLRDCWGVHPRSSKMQTLCWNSCPKLGTKQVSVSMSGSWEGEHQAFHPALNNTLFQHVFPSIKMKTNEGMPPCPFISFLAPYFMVRRNESKSLQSLNSLIQELSCTSIVYALQYLNANNIQLRFLTGC